MQFNIGTDLLSPDEQNQIRDLLLAFPDVFSDKPSRSNLIEYEIRLRDQSLCVQLRHRVPENLKPQIEAKLKLLDGQFIRKFHNSVYALSLVVVQKKIVTLQIDSRRKKLSKPYLPCQ